MNDFNYIIGPSVYPRSCLQHSAHPINHIGCVWIKYLVRENEIEIEMVDDPMAPVRSFNFFISILFFLTKSEIQTQPKKNYVFFFFSF